jgi:hypothetical protein
MTIVSNNHGCCDECKFVKYCCYDHLEKHRNEHTVLCPIFKKIASLNLDTMFERKMNQRIPDMEQTSDKYSDYIVSIYIYGVNNIDNAARTATIKI